MDKFKEEDIKKRRYKLYYDKEKQKYFIIRNG
jgi:hypothetical protein